MRTEPVRIALLGAESTGKTSLCKGITQALRAQGLEVTAVPETLREWCEANGRTPQAHEQSAIAQQHAERIFSIRKGFVISDTITLMNYI